MLVCYVNKLFTLAREVECVKLYECAHECACVRKGGQECLQQAAVDSVLSNANVRTVFSRNAVNFTHRTSKYF